MAKLKIHDFPAAAPLLADKLLFQTGAGVTSFCTLGQLFEWARIHEYSALGTPGVPSVSNAAYSAYAKRTSSPITTPVDSATKNGITVDVASTTSARFVAAAAGQYEVQANICCSAAAARIFQWTWHKNGSPLDTVGATDFAVVGGSGLLASCCPRGIVSCAANDYLDVRVKSNNASAGTVALYVVSLTMVRVGPA
jgi:hypothetical protein